MTLSGISLHNIRSYELFQATFDPSLTLILGKNGTGKTTLLEAIYLLERGTSFRGRDRDMIAHGQTQAEMRIDLDGGNQRRVKLVLSPDEKITKSFEIDGKKSSRLTNATRMPVVFFEPEELRALSSSPQRRRDFFDGIIARLSPTYASALSRFGRTLLQRNELLKQAETMDHTKWGSHMFAWNVKFAELATAITKARINFIAKSNAHIADMYSQLAGSSHKVNASYSLKDFDDSTFQQTLVRQLEQAHISDIARGFTSIGPHRDDILVQLGGHPVLETASRGEMRTIMLAYKLLEVILQEEISGSSPLILLDDVFSELDIDREKQLMHALVGYQTIITATDLRDELKVNGLIVNL